LYLYVKFSPTSYNTFSFETTGQKSHPKAAGMIDVKKLFHSSVSISNQTLVQNIKHHDGGKSKSTMLSLSANVGKVIKLTLMYFITTTLILLHTKRSTNHITISVY